MTLRGATDTTAFRTYVQQVLRPTLRPGDLVVRDNLSSHKSEPTLALLAQAGVQVFFLPAYSPDFNPIEKMWSKVKAYLRKAGSTHGERTLCCHRPGPATSHRPRCPQLVCFW